MIYLRTPVLLDLVPYTDIVARNNETDLFYIELNCRPWKV